jgi:protein-S-isoprenylcysteine O-methyltransferase Ste14
MTSEYLLRIMFWILILCVLIMRIVFVLRVRLAGERVMPDRAAVTREGVPAFLVRVIGGFLVAGVLAAYALQPAWLAVLSIPIPGIIRWAGFFLGLAGLGVWIWAQIALGKEWSPQLQLRKGHRLITTGLYARMRHPLYSGMILWAGGLALVSASWIFIALTGLVSAALLMRIPREEQMMIGEFGEEYREYRDRTGSLYPKR